MHSTANHTDLFFHKSQVQYVLIKKQLKKKITINVHRKNHHKKNDMNSQGDWMSTSSITTQVLNDISLWANKGSWRPESHSKYSVELSKPEVKDQNAVSSQQRFIQMRKPQKYHVADRTLDLFFFFCWQTFLIGLWFIQGPFDQYSTGPKSDF